MQQWKTIIRPKTGLLEIPLKELWQYRGMIWMLVKRNYQVRNKQMLLGPAWILGETILSTGLFSFVFGYVGGFQSDGMPYFLFYMTGGILWSLFSSCASGNSSVFLDNSWLFGKIYFPRLVIPAAQVLENWIYFFIRLVVCIGVWAVFFLRGEIGWGGTSVLLLPVLVLELSMLGAALGLLVSSLSVRYRDLSYAIKYGMPLLMYTAPVVYPMEQLPEAVRTVVLLNPAAPVIEAFRYCLTGCGQIHTGALCLSAAVTVVCLAGAVILYNQVEKSFIDLV